MRLVDAVGAEGCSGAGHHRLAAMGGHDRGDLRRIGCHRDPADAGGLGAPHHMHDHRQARDIGERLAGQAGGGHAGRDQHQDAGIGHLFKGLETGRFPHREMGWGWAESRVAYTGCQTPGKPISQWQNSGKQ